MLVLLVVKEMMLVMVTVKEMMLVLTDGVWLLHCTLQAARLAVV